MAKPSRIVPTKTKPEKKIPVNFRLKQDTLERLDEIAGASGNDKTWVLEQLVEWGHRQWKAEQARH